MARCEVCCWGEVDMDSVDGGEVCAACQTAMENARTEEREVDACAKEKR